MPTQAQFKRLIKDQGMTIKDVSYAIGLKSSTLSSYLNGHTMDLHKTKYYRLCDVLGLDTRY